jgi:outer membrane protein TolC
MKNSVSNSLFSFAAFAGLTAFHPAPTLAASLTLSGYLEQVQNQSPSIQSSSNTIEGSEKSAKESDLITMPRFFFTGSRTTDHRQFYNAFMGGRTTADNFNLGFEKQFDFGLNAKLSYSLLNNTTSNLFPGIFPGGMNVYSAAQTQLDLNQSLWRNLFGKETKATEDLAEAASLATHYGERFKLKQTLAQAETAYHRVAIANESVRLERELLDRSKKILDWTEKRVNNHLTDKIDFLQSRAGFQGRKMSLENALNELQSAALSFNQFRNQSSGTIAEDVSLIPTSEILALAPPKKAEVTDDVKAAEQAERLNRANQELSLQKALPDFSVFATAAFNGQNGLQSQAMSTAFTSNYPYTAFGVKLSFPIYFWETSEMRAGRTKQQLSAEQATQQKILENTQTWSDLSQKFTEAQGRLKMANELVTMQKEKLEYEKYRFELGRTTTYQVLTFEQDYAQALISRLMIEREILSLHAQLKTYAAE